MFFVFSQSRLRLIRFMWEMLNRLQTILAAAFFFFLKDNSVIFQPKPHLFLNCESLKLYKTHLFFKVASTQSRMQQQEKISLLVQVSAKQIQLGICRYRLHVSRNWKHFERRQLQQTVAQLLIELIGHSDAQSSGNRLSLKNTLFLFLQVNIKILLMTKLSTKKPQ